jgi:hypothetical protein
MLIRLSTQSKGPKIMTKLFAAFALAATISAPALAQEASPERSFTRDGVTYVYTATKVGDTTVLAGRASPVGGPFKLTVRGKQVNGRAGGVPVSFAVDRPLARSATTLAAR